MIDRAEAIRRFVAEDSKRDCFGFRFEAIADFMTFEEARPLLRPDVTTVDWVDAKPWADEAVVETMREYMGRIGWDKCLDHRGISAGRTLEKMRVWIGLLGGHDDLLAFIDDQANYPQYGAPCLKRICDVFGFDQPTDDEDYQRMILGQRCTATYDCGCCS